MKCSAPHQGVDFFHLLRRQRAEAHRPGIIFYFGIQEWCRFDSLVYDMFPGLPVVRGGYMYPGGKPGPGIDFDEALAAKYPPVDEVDFWTQTRLPDGTPVRP